MIKSLSGARKMSHTSNDIIICNYMVNDSNTIICSVILKIIVTRNLEILHRKYQMTLDVEMWVL